MDLRCLYDSLSGPGVNELLQLPKAILNSSFENRVQVEVCLFPISSKMLVSTWRWSTVLKEEWRVFHKLSRERHGWLLYLIASTAGNLCLLTQFMSSQGPQLLLATSWILVSKKALLVVLTIFLNNFQSSRHLDSQYILRDRLQSLFHHILECFVILTLLALAFQACLILAANRLITCSRDSRSKRFVVSSDLKTQMTSLMNSSSSSLFFDRENLEVIMCSSSMGIVIVRETWSEMSLQDGWIEWLLSSLDLLWRNIRSITESDSPDVSEYLVGIGLVGAKRSKLNKSTRIKRSSLIEEWWVKEGSYRLSLMLKLPVIMIKLLIFISVSLRYFKAEWKASE